MINDTECCAKTQTTVTAVAAKLSSLLTLNWKTLVSVFYRTSLINALFSKTQRSKACEYEV